ncbi:DUF6514 family protein [Anaeromicropila herbilytica]|uniref:Uncharacterized protein n=1 Tax=Anaeromicropila herbilytica TaxID=2785025 RepID=A0A7R7IBV7_9FIRM|nr:DUF6514 family protein [Anaeromicropila herbilytica]BCN29992.1 hypothetical protein bsdtb5_12870 [Anaeromicropila herbilytica]
MTILKLSEDIFISLSKILKVNYEVLQFNLADVDSDSNISYGIKVYYSDNNLTNPYSLCEVSNISSNKDFVIDLAVKLASNQVLPVHTRDIIEDSIECLYV